MACQKNKKREKFFFFFLRWSAHAVIVKFAYLLEDKYANTDIAGDLLKTDAQKISCHIECIIITIPTFT